MNSPLLLTKLHIPSVRLPLVQRDRLMERLNQGMDCKLLLISAPAGFGKTTVFSEWLRQIQKPVTWLSLDEGDNDPLRFWSYVVAALQQIQPEIGEATLALLQSPEPVPFEAFIIPLINEIADLKTEIVFVLDDYHVITAQSIHKALTFLLDHAPPHFHLAIASRVDPPLPLARLRARGELIELRAADLQFTIAETTTFINQVMKLSLSKEQVDTIQARTEGWIVGLQLATLLMQDTEDVSTFIDALKGTQRHILDYLVEEVLEHQSPSLRSFLLQTSILDRLCGELCNAMIEDDSIDGTELLEQLERRNLFILPLDHERQWYRYHHLFQELLQHQLRRVEPERIPEYHKRAAQWYDQQGLVMDAIHHAIAAEAFEWAADLIEQEGQRTHYRFESGTLLLSYLEVLPSQMIWTRPWLLLAYTWALFSSSQFAAAATAVQTIERLLQQPDCVPANPDKLYGLVTAFKGMHARMQGATSESVVLIEKSLQQLPQDDSWIRAIILVNLGVTYFVADNFAAAEQLLPEVTRIGQRRGFADPAIAGLYLQAQFLVLRGRIDEAIGLCQQGLELAQQRNWLATYAGVLVQVALAELLREQNQLDAATHHLTESIDRAIQNRQPGLMMGYVTLARVCQAQGNLSAAWEAIRAAEQCQVWLWPTMLSVPACKARLHLAQGNLDGVIAWVETSGLSVDDELHYSFTDPYPVGSELDYLTLARVLIAQGRSTPTSTSALDAAMQLLDRLYVFTQAGRRTARVMEVLLLQALVWQARGEVDRALSFLEQAFEMPHAGDYIRLFADEGKPMMELLQYAASRGFQFQFVKRLLSMFNHTDENVSATIIQPFIEPLSERELEILHHLSKGLSNQTIADKLYVSLAAVKWHARNIYGKLNVNNRTQAVARARELGILA
jgi:LuxR family transcriptional regulator, maltose regulon positive regulatory protein